MLGLLIETRPVYAGSDGIVLPSHREGFPNVPLQAAALERPVVTTLAVGCRDAVVPDVTEMHVPVGDVHGLTETIARYLESADLRLAHGRAGRRRRLAEYSPPRMPSSITPPVSASPAPVTGIARPTTRSAELSFGVRGRQL